MATITKIQKASGTSYRAQIRIKKKGVVVHSEAQTWPTERAARAWGAKREEELAKPGALEAAKHITTTVRDLVLKYIEQFCGNASVTKKAALGQLSRHEFTDIPYSELQSKHIVDHAIERSKKVQPATVLNDLIWLREVIKTAYPAWGYRVDVAEVDAAMKLCSARGLTAPSVKRDRRPTLREIEMLDKAFSNRRKGAKIPMRDIMWFAIYSSRRGCEIVKLRRSDNNEKDRTGVVRGIKHPRKKNLNKTFRYHDKAWEIMKRQPDTGDIIFPYKSESIGDAFAYTAERLGIEDLVFHDFRHEATSRLFEEGYPIQEVAMFTLHESWENLKRYANLKPENVRSLPQIDAHPQPSAHPGKQPKPARKSTNAPSGKGLRGKRAPAADRDQHVASPSLD
jgi:integrase